MKKLILLVFILCSCSNDCFFNYTFEQTITKYVIPQNMSKTEITKSVEKHIFYVSELSIEQAKEIALNGTYTDVIYSYHSKIVIESNTTYLINN